MTTASSQPHSARFFIVGTLLLIIFAAAVTVIGIFCSIASWQMAFVERRITKVEGIIGAAASLMCVALNISLLISADPLTLPMIVASLFIMGNIAMTERARSEQRAQERLRQLGPLMYVGKKPIEDSAVNGSPDRSA